MVGLGWSGVSLRFRKAIRRGRGSSRQGNPQRNRMNYVLRGQGHRVGRTLGLQKFLNSYEMFWVTLVKDLRLLPLPQEAFLH